MEHSFQRTYPDRYKVLIVFQKVLHWDPKKSNISIPNGKEVGANNNWLPGGYTSGGIPEGVVHNVPNNSSYIKVTFLDNALN